MVRLFKGLFRNLKISTEIFVMTMVLVMLISLTYTLVNYVDESYSDHAIDHIHAGARTAECLEKAAG